MEEYVHRVGRTGRAGKTGTSITLWDKADWKHAADLIEILEEAGQEVPDFLRREAIRYNINSQAWYACIDTTLSSDRYKEWKDRKDRERAARRGEGGDRGGRDGCFRCGEPGHFSRECPQGGCGGRGGRRR